MKSRSLQEWIRELDAGAARRILTGAAIAIGVALLVTMLCNRQFRGPRDEATLAQLAAARGWAAGSGHTTGALHPQALAVLESRSVGGAPGQAIPELYQPPGYAFVVGLLLRAIPDAWLSQVSAPPDGVGADYAVLVLNAVAVVVAAFATWRVARSAISARAAVWAGWGVLASAPLWAGAVALDGSAFPALLTLGAFAVADKLARRWDSSNVGLLWAGFLGAILSLLALFDYPWLVAVPIAVAWVAVVAPQKCRVPCSIAVLAGAVAVFAPWAWRNVALSGGLFGLAGQNLFLRLGDGGADPVAWRGLWTIAEPIANWTKVGGKLLGHARDVALSDFWASAWLLAALAIAGVAFAYRDVRRAQLRALSGFWLAAVVCAEGAMGSGEPSRSAVVACVPLIALWGASFLDVLVESRSAWSVNPLRVTACVLALQSLPLLRDVLEPRRIHFFYPPYYPVLLASLGDEVASRGGGGWSWMSDIPAGSAWYSGRPVYGLPSEAAAFREISSRRPVLGLLLTAQTLDRPFYSALARRDGEQVERGWQWADVYRGLAIGRLPPGFPLSDIQEFAPNLVLLSDPNSPRSVKQ